MERIASIDGLFHDGNPFLGVKGTIVTAAWLNALQEIVVGHGGDIVTSAVSTTLTEAHGILFANPAEGETVTYHLPVYGLVGNLKRYKIKNIGQGVAEIDAADGKTLDGEALLSLAPGDRCEIAKDGANWQTF